jgi:hypothetical protein
MRAVSVNEPGWDNTAMNAPQPTMSPRARLQELLAIPERERTDAQWDEINELEIKRSSANRKESLDRETRRNTPAAATGHSKLHVGAQGRKPFQKFHARHPKQKLP